MKGFIDFIRENGVVGLAIGFIMGGAVSGLVSSLVDDIINPLIGLLVGNTDLSSYSITIADTSISYGVFITNLVNFVIIAAVVYWLFKWLHLEKLDKQKDS